MGCAAPAAQKATSAFEDDVSTDSLVDAMAPLLGSLIYHLPGRPSSPKQWATMP